MLSYYLPGHSQYSSPTRSTRLPTRSTRLSTRSTHLSTRRKYLTARSTRRTIGRSFYNWSVKMMIFHFLTWSSLNKKLTYMIFNCAKFHMNWNSLELQNYSNLLLWFPTNIGEKKSWNIVAIIRKHSKKLKVAKQSLWFKIHIIT